MTSKFIFILIYPIILTVFLANALLAETTLSISPSSNTIEPEQTFTTTVDISNVTNFCSIELEIQYDPDFICAQNIEDSNFLASTGRTLYPLSNEFNCDTGILKYAVASFGNTPGPDGNGTICTITWKANHTSGNTHLNISLHHLTDNLGNLIDHTATNVSFSIENTQPPDITALFITHQLISLAPKDTFTTTVNVSDINDIGAFEFTLCFNPAMLCAKSVSVGDFLGSTGRTLFPVAETIDCNDGKLVFAYGSFGNTAPSGDGELAIIQWQVSDAASQPITIHVQKSQLTDPLGNVIVHETQDIQIPLTEKSIFSDLSIVSDSLTDTAFHISWNKISGSPYYQLYRATKNNFLCAIPLTNWITNTTIHDTTIVPGITYYYWIKASSEPAELSDTVMSDRFSSSTILKSPKGVTCGIYANQIRLYWEKIIGASHYQVYRSLTSAFENAVTVTEWLTENEYTDYSVQSGTTYYYWLESSSIYADNKVISDISTRIKGETLIPVSNNTFQIITPYPAVLNVPAGNKFYFDVLCSSSGNETEPNTVSINVHYNSHQVGFVGYTTVNETEISPPENSTDIPFTDQKITIWGTGSQLSEKLCTLCYTVSESLPTGITSTIVITSNETHHGYSLITIPVQLKVSSFNLDIDGNGVISALQDGLLILRYLFNITEGDPLTNNAIDMNATRRSDINIQTFIEKGFHFLDVDGNSKVDALSDGLLIIRYMFGMTSDSGLITNAISTNAIRTTSDEVSSYLRQLR
jgi:hypothetical protein